ncbi:MAG: hypothetical protein QNJ54_29250 [Prochloraceae cyanobacterium]|nr:hypothetical protein [Prochloraceae cyanobacterium]
MRRDIIIRKRVPYIKISHCLGDEFEITLGRRHIYLKKIEKEQESEVEELSSAS